MRKSNLLLLLSFFVLLISCQKEIKLDEDLTNPKLVVQAIVEIDQPFKIYIERTFSYLEQNNNFLDQTNKFRILSGATITVVNNTTGDSFTSNTPEADSSYQFPFNVTPNTSYSITVTHPDYPTVTTTTVTTEAIPIISLDTTSMEMNGEPLLQCSMKWQDPPGDNYYLVRAKVEYFDTISGSSGYHQWISSIDPVADNSANSDPENTGPGSIYYVFTDEQFKNALKSFSFTCHNPFNYNMGDDVRLTFSLVSLNHDTYLYYKSALIQYFSDPTFSEPSKIYTNISNGYGVFGSVSASKIIYE